MPLIQISDDNPTGTAVSHFRNVKVVNRKDKGRRPLVNLGGGPRTPPQTPHGVPVYLHDYYGPGRHAKVVSTHAPRPAGRRQHLPRGAAADRRRVARGRGARRRVPQLLDPVDDLPPATVITHVRRETDGTLHVRGTASARPRSGSCGSTAARPAPVRRTSPSGRSS